MHHTARRRFDPGRCEGACPVCGANTSAETGQPTPQHQPLDGREMCPGAGQPSL